MLCGETHALADQTCIWTYKTHAKEKEPKQDTNKHSNVDTERKKKKLFMHTRDKRIMLNLNN